ncbi:MAG TPA: T9SS type A sorting domain-containing protein [Puia sp.]|nr:T9SS type A sorting domain-containing protein [Puia sp.]
MSKLWLTLALALCWYASRSQTSVDDFPGAISSSDMPLFSYFTVSAGAESSVLKWGVNMNQPDEYYIVEKSSDGNRFETISAIGSGTGRADTNFTATDNAAGNGTVYYRIRITGKDGKSFYSKTISVLGSAVSDFRFYPNPVDKLLIIRCVHPLIIQIMDAYGTVWFTQEVNAGMQIVNVSTLQKGNYILKVTDRETNRSRSEQLIKN